MGFPYDADPQAIVPGTTALSYSNWGAPIVAAIRAIFSGTLRVKKVEVNGAGGASTTAGPGEIVAAGLIESSTSVNGPKLSAFGARGSATPGAGQSMAAGDIRKDSVIFAHCRLKQTAANTVSVTRSLNLASAPTEAVAAKYVFALQTAAPNGLIVFAQVVGAGSFQWTVQPGSLTTSGFEIWTYAGDGTTLTELSVNDELHVMVVGY